MKNPAHRLIAATIFAILSSTGPVVATIPQTVEENDEKLGGNASDKATMNPPPVGPASADSLNRPPGYYQDLAEFWGLFLSSGSPFIAGYRTGLPDKGELSDPPSLQLVTAPVDGPAESILDDIDDGPILLVGEPGNHYARPAGTGAGTASDQEFAPPPESILDQLDEAAQEPQPPSGAATGQPAKSAVNAAPRPGVVETAR